MFLIDKTRLEFPTLMNWASSHLTEASVRMVTDEESFSPFKWARLVCRVQGESSSQNSSGQVAFSEDKRGSSKDLALNTHHSNGSYRRLDTDDSTTGAVPTPSQPLMMSTALRDDGVSGGEGRPGEVCLADQCIRFRFRLFISQ
ncbi:hypothetical protein ACOMHN_011279 [Nucella lapillus]